MCHGNWHSKWGRHGWGPHHKHYGPGRWQHRRGTRFSPPVNIEEMDERYELSLIAPGRKKEDFRVAVKDDVLSIHAPRPGKTEVEPNWRRQEYELVAIERQFQLNDKIDAEGISATYNDGILLVTLPKKPGADTPDQEILVA